jgi:predicted RNase H-related nuclease YkuK (DUF458 family)
MIEEARKAISESSEQSSVYIGSDSMRYKREDGWYAKYSTVIILHKDSKHGCSLWYDTIILKDFNNLKHRLITEASLAINAALDIIEVIGNRKLEVHLDLNPNPKYKSNIAVAEALGYVKGFGIEAKIKPDAFAATHCADFIARK